MIILQCDICKNETKKIDTLVLYKKSIDYCENCKDKANKVREQFKREVKYENVVFDSWLKSKEIKILKEITKK